MAKQVNIFDFYHKDIEPQVFNSIKELFSEFTLRAKKWESPLKLDGVSEARNHRRDKTYIEDPRRKGKQHIRVAEQGGDNIDFLEFVQLRHHLSNVEAVKFIANTLGITIPQGTTFDEEKYEERKAKQKRLEGVLSQMKEALFSTEGEAVLDYLKTKRGYTEEYIKEQPFGFFSASMSCYREMREDLLHYELKETKKQKGLCEYSFTKYNKATMQSEGVGIGYTHTLAIAFVADGEIKGFKFRTILSEGELENLKTRLDLRSTPPKYLAAYIGEWDTQGSFPIALPSGKLTEYSDRYLNFTAVEGELDTYRGLEAGVLNVVGLSQGGLTQTQLKKLKQRGAQSITILKDTEALLKEDGSSNEESIKKNERAVANAVQMIETQGLKSYVLYLPSQNGEKTDLDSYLKGLSGEALEAKGRELQEMIDKAEGGYTFLYRLLQKEYEETPKGEKDLRLFTRRTQALTRKEECDIVDKKNIYTLFKAATGLSLEEPSQAVEAQGEGDIEQEEALRSAQNALEVRITQAGEEIHTDAEKALQTLKGALSDYETATAEDLSEYRKVKTQEERKKEQEGAPVGIYTDFVFYSKMKEGGEYHRENLLLPSQSLSYFCLPSGQGKTRLIENIAFQVLKKEEKGAVLFFTLEEPLYKIENAFLNLHINRQLSSTENNVLTLKRYKSEADPEKQRSLFTNSIYPFDTFRRQEREFYSKYIHSGRLRIYYEPSGSIRKIGKIVRYLERVLTEEEGSPILAVFIDYVQRLKGEANSHTDKKAGMSEATEELMHLAEELKVPFVLSAQLNRQAVSPLDMSISNMADAAEIERSASVVFLGWNTAFSPLGNGEFARKERYEGVSEEELKEKTKESKNNKNSLAAEIWSLRTGLTLGTSGHLYGVLAKNRDSEADLEAVLDLEGNTGTITQGMRTPEMQEDALRKTEEGLQRSLFQKQQRQSSGGSVNVNESGSPEQRYSQNKEWNTLNEQQEDEDEYTTRRGEEVPF